MKIKLIVAMIFLQITISAYNFLSPMIKQARVNIPEAGECKFAEKQVIINSEKVYNDSILYIRDQDYTIDYSEAKITFQQSPGQIKIEYMIYPSNLLDRFYYYKVREYSDSLKFEDSMASKRLFYHNTNLNITGNKTISVSLSNDDNFDLDQSLFLKINGDLSDDIKIEAQLTDSQSPITPEGDSQQLSNLDKVFLRIYGRNYELAFGDLEMQFSNTEFINYTPKFEGLKIGWENINYYKGAMAISKGKKKTIDFKGVEAKQGPYYLNTESVFSLQVVPGTEEVHLNGEKMQRGMDYTIDYSEGSIMFTNSHFISSNSFIQVSFQYSDQDYRQNMYLASSQIEILENLDLKNYLIIQNDDRNNPLAADLSDEEISFLENVGDSPAWIDGVNEVEGGSYKLSGNGQYYIYVGNDSTQTGQYNIYFTDVGYGNGDYALTTDGNYFEFIGEGEGSYLPIKELVKPENKLNYDLIVDYDLGFIKLYAEGLLTSLDKNSFSEIDDKDNLGYATKIAAEYHPNFDQLDPNFQLSYKKKSEELAAFASIRDPKDSYEVTDHSDSLETDELKLNLNMDIFDFVKPQIIYRQQRVKDHSTLNYLLFSSQFQQRKYFPNIFQRAVLWQNKYEEALITKSNYSQNFIDINYKIVPFNLGLEYYYKEQNANYEDGSNQENKQERFKYNIEYTKDSKFATQLFISNETQSEVLDNNQNERETSSIGLKTKLNSKDHNFDCIISHREIQDSTKQKYDMAEINIQSSLIKDALNLRTYYSLQNVEFYPKLKEFLFVGDDQGSYDIDTVFVGFGEGDYDWEITAIDYDDPQMSIEVRSNSTLYFNPGMITDSFWNRFQTETQLTITENSKESEKIKVYFLNPDILMDENNTIYGRNTFQQLLWLDIMGNDINSRFKFKSENSMDKRYLENSETSELNVWEGKVTIKTLKNTNLELIYEKRSEENSRYSSKINMNNYEIDMRNRLNSELIMRSTLGFSEESGSDDLAEDSYQITALEIKEDLTYFWKKYRFLSGISFRKNKRTGSEFLGFINEKKNGNIFKWYLDTNFKMNDYTSINVHYSGNSYPQRKDIHKLSAEVKAEF